MAMSDRRFLLLVLVGVVLLAAAARLLPHPPNVTPVTAMALFAGAHLVDRRLAYGLPLLALLLSDLVLGLHPQMVVVYACFALVTWLGSRLPARRGAGTLAAASLTGSTLFFLITNLAVWAFDALYPLTLDGLLACYAAAIPFFRNSLLGDLLYTGLLFGGFAWLAARPGRRPAVRQAL
jgi:hypothetical protein